MRVGRVVSCVAKPQDLLQSLKFETYSYTPVGAVKHTDQPQLDSINDPSTYFGLWASGKTFAISAWNLRKRGRFAVSLTID